MISRHFFKVKQRYDETVNQADKTEMMNADLSQVYKTVEIMKNTFIETRKKLKDFITSFTEDGKKGKNAELVLGRTLLGEADKYPTESLLHSILQSVGSISIAMSMEFSSYELNVDDNFRKELVKIIEYDIENLDKLKKKLNKARLDLDACKSRNKSSQGQNLSAQKQQLLEQELADASTKFENTKDQFTIELLNFISREKEFSMLYISMIEAARDFHAQAYKILDDALPGVRKLAETTIFQPVFGFPIGKHREIFGQTISFVIQECIDYIEKNGLTTEGIFRCAGSANRVVNLAEDVYDVHTVAACLKTYLRELPEPLLTFALEGEFYNSASLDINSRSSAIKNLVKKLPPDNYANLKYVMEFLVKIASKSNENKMNPHNIAIVIGPNLLWCKDTDKQLQYSNAAAAICESMVTKFDQIFKSSIESPNADGDADDSKLKPINHGNSASLS